MKSDSEIIIEKLDDLNSNLRSIDKSLEKLANRIPTESTIIEFSNALCSNLKPLAIYFNNINKSSKNSK